MNHINTRFKLEILIITLVVSGLVASCGGTSFTNPTVTIGTITGFGSVFVNGIEFETDNADFDIDDSAGTEDDLAIGQVVRVEGSVSSDGQTGRADNIIFDKSVEGQITSIDLNANEFVVLGQTISVNDSTVFDDNVSNQSLSGLMVGDAVEVSALTGPTNTLIATRVELTTLGGGDVEVHGAISNLDTVNHLFDINALTVDYTGATLSNFTDDTPANGDIVEVHGNSFGGGGQLIADQVEREDSPFSGVDSDTQVEIEGVITRFISAAVFDVNGQPVATNGSTEFENGDSSDLELGIKVEVEGTVNSDDILVAEKVSLRRENDAGVEALVEELDVDAGTLTVLGIPITVDDLTSFEDNSDADVRQFGMDDLNVGDFVEIRGAEVIDNEITASELRRDDAGDEFRVQGLIDALVDETSVSLLGVLVNVDGSTEYQDASEFTISSTEFFANASVDTAVEATGTQTGDATILATELKLEDINIPR